MIQRTLQSTDLVPALGHDVPGNHECQRTDTVLFAGTAKTDPGTNTTVIDLTACPGGPPVPKEPKFVSFVATPLRAEQAGRTPILLWAPQPGPKVQVWSVDAGGGSVNDTEFGWHCVVEVVLDRTKSFP